MTIVNLSITNNILMKNVFILIILATLSHTAFPQSCSPSCTKQSCGPDGTKKEEAAVITRMRTDLQTVISKLSQSSMPFDKALKHMKIEKGTSDDESLLYLAQAAASIRYELIHKIESSRLIASLKDFKPSGFSTKQQMVANLRKEIQLLADQAEKL